MTQPAPTADPEMRALMEQVVRFGIYLLRWIVRRYGLNITV